MIGEENTLNIWDIEYPKAPIVVLEAHAQCHCLEYNPKEPQTLVGGMVTGQTAAFDVRSDTRKPVMISIREKSHKDRVNAVTFYCSKTNMEFFSGLNKIFQLFFMSQSYFYLGSAAGEVFWWDLRYLESPIDTMLLNPKSIVDGIKNDDKAFGVSFYFVVLF